MKTVTISGKPLNKALLASILLSAGLHARAETPSTPVLGSAKDLIAIIAAVERYANPLWQERFGLEGPANDANLLVTKLLEIGVPANKIHAFVSDDERHASRAQFDKLRAQLAQSGLPDRNQLLAAMSAVAKEDLKGKTVLLYFSGHGKRIRKTADQCVTVGPAEMDSNKDARFALVLMDAALSPSCEGLLFDAEIKEMAQAVNSRNGRLLVVLDSCFAGALRLVGISEEEIRGECSCGRNTSKFADDSDSINATPTVRSQAPAASTVPRANEDEAAHGEQRSSRLIGQETTLNTATGWRYLAVMATPQDATADEVCLPRIAEPNGPQQQCHGYLTFAFVQSLEGTYDSLADWKHRGLDYVYIQNGNSVLPEVSFHR